MGQGLLVQAEVLYELSPFAGEGRTRVPLLEGENLSALSLIAD